MNIFLFKIFKSIGQPFPKLICTQIRQTDFKCHNTYFSQKYMKSETTSSRCNIFCAPPLGDLLYGSIVNSLQYFAQEENKSKERKSKYCFALYGKGYYRFVLLIATFQLGQIVKYLVRLSKMLTTCYTKLWYKISEFVEFEV